MTEQTPSNFTPGDTPDVPPVPEIPNLEYKAAALLVLMLVLICSSVVYLMYARGAFEATQQLILLADDSEGVSVGMDVTFSGFPIGRIRRIELSNEGKARMIVDITKKDAHWLRSSSIFTLERGLVGGTRIRAFTGIPTDPVLKDGESRTVLVGDATAEIPRIMAATKDLIQNLTVLTAAGSSLDASLGNVKTMTEKLNGPGGAMGLIAGDDKASQKLLAAIDRANTLLARVDGLALKADGLVAKADTRVFGSNGVMNDAQAAIVQLNGVLSDARTSLKKVDAVLAEAQAVGANVKVATTDLGMLRADVESNLRKIEQLVNEINRKWPFARDAELKLP